MGTVYNVRVVGSATESSVAALQQQVDLRLAAINQQMSTYLPDSEISRFNVHVGDDWFSVSAETALVVAAGQQVSRDTQGAFDVTVGPLVNLWGFGPAGRIGEMPTDQAIAECLGRVGYALLEVRQQPPALRKHRADVYVDLSAIAKGFAVDEIAQIAEEVRSAETNNVYPRVTEAMIEVEGEAMRPVTWVRIKEFAGGDWAIGGKALQAADVQALGKAKAA